MTKETKNLTITKEEIIELIKKALLHKDDDVIGSLVTAQGKLRTANFNHWIEQNL